MAAHPWNVEHILHELGHYLPSQAALKDFIHHNTLHAFQGMKFYDALKKAGQIFGYKVTFTLDEFRNLYAIERILDSSLDRAILQRKPAEDLALWRNKLLNESYPAPATPRIGSFRSRWKSEYQIDLDNHVQPLLFRILCSYLDQGIALEKFPTEPEGFLASLRAMEKSSYVSFFRSKQARSLFLDTSTSIEGLLNTLVGNSNYFDRYIFDQQFSHPGWSGIVRAIETFPAGLLIQRKITLKELLFLELVLELDAVTADLGTNWKPLAEGISDDCPDLFAEPESTELQEVLRIFQDAFEWGYYDGVLNGVTQRAKQPITRPVEKSFQGIFCIDERECSMRRHVEQVDPDCETYGFPGFFAVEFYFLPAGGHHYDKLCPAPVFPKYLIKEKSAPREHERIPLYHAQSHSLGLGMVHTLLLGGWAYIKSLLQQFRPRMTPAISNAPAYMNKQAELTIENVNTDDRENGWQIGFTVPEMAQRVEAMLRGIGLISDFAPIVYVIAHGSSSANNPHHGAHDCGACSGRPGSTNARVVSWMANHQGVRKLLKERGITIPEETQFVGSMHDTAADQMEFYDLDVLSMANRNKHQENVISFEEAMCLNARERSRRFVSIRTDQPIEKIRKAILDRSVSLFEPRPELGHGTNSLCFIGNRDVTRGLFLDRRAFMHSYDYRTDPTGQILKNVIRPIALVCGGINLEYYFSRIDNIKLGAGTKLPHNVMGLIGVANSCDGDLRPGLPVQMIEVHDPVRLLIIVEQTPDIVLQAIQQSPEIYEWYINEWVHLIALDPLTGKYHRFVDGKFTEYVPELIEIPSIEDSALLVNKTRVWESYQNEEATVENLPVHIIQSVP